MLGRNLAVQGDAVPEGQENRLVVGVLDASLHVRRGVARHDRPNHPSRVRVLAEQAIVLFLRDAVRVLARDIDCGPADPAEELRHVRLVAPAAERLVCEDRHRIGLELRLRDEKPLSLPDESRVPAEVSLLLSHAEAVLLLLHGRGLERLLGVLNRGGLVAHTGDKPVALVVAAQEL